ncbi:hypothetical protein ILUMI_21511 [Ignelater luminosus]|uniref:Uncharacterized protein n=1 Tax=Ignelater luminosus TaxID=2038154 RepID=A0A8K0CG96_IGNLU|nr:hypothetical protein ILUMI_21511 [Ignelater luminosus]
MAQASRHTEPRAEAASTNKPTTEFYKRKRDSCMLENKIDRTPTKEERQLNTTKLQKIWIENLAKEEQKVINKQGKTQESEETSFLKPSLLFVRNSEKNGVNQRAFPNNDLL